MADTKISALSAGTAAPGDEIPVNRGGTNFKITAGDILKQNSGTLTASAPALDLTQTWNASGVTFTGLKFNATDTASNAASLLMDLQVGGTSQFKVTKAGAATFGGDVSVVRDASVTLLLNATTGTGQTAAIKFQRGTSSDAFTDWTIQSNAGDLLFLRDSSGSQTTRISFPDSLFPAIQISNDKAYAFSSTNAATGTADLFLGRKNPANLQLGAADAAAPVAQTLGVQSVVAGTSNTAGANFTIRGSQGTGTGAGGSIIFQTAPAGSSGTSQNALVTALTISASGTATFSSSGTVQTGILQSTTVDNPCLDIRGATVPNFTGVGFGPNVTTTTTGRWSQASATNGGVAFSGFNSSSDVVPPLNFSGYLSKTTGNTQPAIAFVGFAWNGSTGRQAVDNADTVARILNSTTTLLNIRGDGLVQFAGTTSSFPALKRSSTSLIVRLADDSADAPFGASTGTFSGAVTAPNLANGKSMGRFTPLDNQPPAANFATLDTRNSVAVLDFDAATDESAVFVGVIPEAATLTSGIVVRLSWAATSATSGDCVWGVQFEKATGSDIDSDSFDTAATGTTTTSGTSGVVNTTSITITTIDSLAAGDCYRLKVYRDADAGGDTMTGDAELVAVEIRSAA